MHTVQTALEVSASASAFRGVCKEPIIIMTETGFVFVKVLYTENCAPH